MSQTAIQRLRATFSRGEACRYVAHLDLMNAWQRLLRRAGVPIAYSEGFSPHPKIAIAAPLPVGVTGERELIDISLHQPWTPSHFVAQVTSQLPPGINLGEVVEVPLAARSLQACLRRAEYRVTLFDERGESALRQAIDDLLAAPSLPREWVREKGPRRYDLRPLVEHLWLSGRKGESWELGLLLAASSQGTGRPEEVLHALGCSPRAARIHRVRLFLEEQT